MCGIAGVFASRFAGDELAAVLAAMNVAQVHRGPDEEGVYRFDPLGAGLASRRLSIVDLEHGQQPLANEDGSIHVVLNGEIYNHESLRESLEAKGHRFRSRSDTEVLVHLYEELGEEFLERLEGMFALAVLDTRRERLLLARDGPGMKPLYWAETPHGLLFASEAKALFATKLLSPAPDTAAMDIFLTAGYVPAPWTMFQGIRRLGAGQYVTAGRGGAHARTFWRFRYAETPPLKSDDEWAEELDALLRKAVRSHLAADVTVGALVSGGWDSSLTATLAAAETSKLKTFSVVFPEDPTMDESRYSRLLARQLGTDHHEIEFRAEQMPQILPRLIRHLEEPVTTVPAGVLFQLASLAATHVKSVISGESADELFGGYEWYRPELPYVVRRLTPRRLFQAARGLRMHPRLQRAVWFLAAPNERRADAEWRRVMTPRLIQDALKPEFRSDGPGIAPILLPAETLATCQDSVQRRLGFDFTARLAEGILFMADKVTMAHSLEARMPFLDRAVVDFALRLPSHLKVHQGREKRILAPLARRHLPPLIAQRRKLGLRYPRRMWAGETTKKFAIELLLDAGDHTPFRRQFLERRLAHLLRAGSRTRGLNSMMFLQSWWNEFIS